uniref:Platelet-activating factor acetylhydrolase IB subunit alpha2 n=1 Tax=Esox lucius TaxID=8010 RepID=A0AAY5KIB8_ESOLU
MDIAITLCVNVYCVVSDRMSGDEMNPAAVAQAVVDVQGDDRWMSQHTRFVLECKDAEPEVLFIGDSMVQLMQQYEVREHGHLCVLLCLLCCWVRHPKSPAADPRTIVTRGRECTDVPYKRAISVDHASCQFNLHFKVWRELFSPLHALNFGIGGDTTCNVLWRLQNGELDNIWPKVAVVWVGTNNYEHSAEQVAGGIFAIAQLLTSRLPKTKVVVLGLLARGERPNPLREKNAAVNGLLRSLLPQLGQAQFLDVGEGFVHSDGTISTRDMFDFLHLTSAGYRAIAKPLSDLLLQILEETPEERRASLV